MKKVFLFFLSAVFIVIVSCNDKKTNNKIVTKTLDNKISEISYDQAVNSYGNPLSMEVFDNSNEDEVFPGIRAGIAKHYKAGVKIKIKEAIWIKNDSIFTAIWYTKKQNDWIPFDSLEYRKGVDF